MTRETILSKEFLEITRIQAARDMVKLHDANRRTAEKAALPQNLYAGIVVQCKFTVHPVDYGDQRRLLVLRWREAASSRLIRRLTVLIGGLRRPDQVEPHR